MQMSKEFTKIVNKTPDQLAQEQIDKILPESPMTQNAEVAMITAPKMTPALPPKLNLFRHYPIMLVQLWYHLNQTGMIPLTLT